MEKIFYLWILFCFLNISIFADDLKKRAQENPLDCALYLVIKTDDKSYSEHQLQSLISSFWKSNRFDDAIKTIELIEDEYGRINQYILYSGEFLKNQNIEQSANLLIKAAEISEGSYDDRQGEKIIRGLLELNESARAMEYIESIEDKEDKTTALILVADILTDKKQSEDALKLLPRALEEINGTKWFDLKLEAMAKVANVFSKNGKKESALKVIEEVKQFYLSIEYPNRFQEQDIFDLIVECYVNLRDYETAIRLLGENQKIDANEKLLKIAQLNSKAGNEEKANKILTQLKQMNSSNMDDDYVLSKTAYEFVKTKDFLKALETTKQIYNEHYKFEIADEFIKSGRNDLAVELLNHIWADVREIETSEEESGLMSTSLQMQKADYLSRIAGRFIKIGQSETALKIINSIEKPYFKAQALTNFASVQKSKISLQSLNQALTIMQSTKDSVLDARRKRVWNEIALGFAETGQKNKSAEIFAEILKLNPENTISSDVIETLSETGYYFEKSGLKSNSKTTNALKKVIKNWEEENY